jgi:hypothetical protein
MNYKMPDSGACHLFAIGSKRNSLGEKGRCDPIPFCVLDADCNLHKAG